MSIPRSSSGHGAHERDEYDIPVSFTQVRFIELLIVDDTLLELVVPACHLLRRGHSPAILPYADEARRREHLLKKTASRGTGASENETRETSRPVRCRCAAENENIPCMLCRIPLPALQSLACFDPFKKRRCNTRSSRLYVCVYSR